MLTPLIGAVAIEDVQLRKLYLAMHYLGRKYNTFNFGEKRKKIKNMVLLPAFFKNMR